MKFFDKQNTWKIEAKYYISYQLPSKYLSIINTIGSGKGPV